MTLIYTSVVLHSSKAAFAVDIAFSSIGFSISTDFIIAVGILLFLFQFIKNITLEFFSKFKPETVLF